MSDDRRLSCQSCRFYEETRKPRGDYLGQGRCRFNPPVLREYDHQDGWPQVTHIDWCGKWRTEDGEVLS